MKHVLNHKLHLVNEDKYVIQRILHFIKENLWFYLGLFDLSLILNIFRELF